MASAPFMDRGTGKGEDCLYVLGRCGPTCRHSSKRTNPFWKLSPVCSASDEKPIIIITHHVVVQEGVVDLLSSFAHINPVDKEFLSRGLYSQPDDDIGKTVGYGVNIFKVLMRNKCLMLAGGVAETDLAKEIISHEQT
ncbi:hypothetical protein GH733_005969 [Mirounga leonina]|nr:hypothetical protein GH733_005969 [Mirounga leonina]